MEHYSHRVLKSERGMLGSYNKRSQGRSSNIKSPHTRASLANGPTKGHGHNARNHFSLEDEARNTERHDQWSLKTQLRHVSIPFINAGSYEGDEIGRSKSSPPIPDDVTTQGPFLDFQPSLESSMSHVTLDSAARAPNGRSNAFNAIAGNSAGSPGSKVRSICLAGNNDHDKAHLFFLDDRQSEALPVTTLSDPKVRVRSSSSVSSVSSEDVVVFKGRNHRQTRLSSSTSIANRKVTFVDDPIHVQSSSQIMHRSMQATRSLPCVLPESAPTEFNEVSRFSTAAGTGKSKGRKKDEEIFEDYLANIAPEDPLARLAMDIQANRHGRADINAIPNVRSLKSEASVPADQQSDDGWDTADLDDFNDLSTSDADISNVRKIIAKRERASGVQYLVVAVGSTSDDARWIPRESLNNDMMREKVEAYEGNDPRSLILTNDYERSDQTTDSSDGALEYLRRDVKIMSDEDLLERTKERMTDEQIARLLSKQEELGLGSDDVLLFDGADGANARDEDHGCDFYTKRGKKIKRLGRKRSTLENREKDFVSAEIFADAQTSGLYNDFDIMDFARPSLPKKKKDRQGPLDFDLSDTDLSLQMAMAWNNDRAKKQRWKEGRQRLREQAQGLNRNVLPDIMGLFETKRQIRLFLESSRPSISFSPMNKRDRRAIHELANRLSLTSKSQGNGHKRFPILYRTRRTPSLTSDEFDRIVQQLPRTFSNLRDDTILGKRATLKRRQGGHSTTTVSCRDGEVVGAGAAELGRENRGRAMLEKMGWSAGTAIGALNNKGIMQPISHIVKTTKAGLG